MNELADIPASEDRRPSTRRLSYAYARQAGILLVNGDEGPQLFYRAGQGLPMATQFEAMLEARRIAGTALTPTPLPPAEFENILAQTYAQGDLSETIEDAMDQPESLASLADTLPTTSDLLDSDDDAPVIRLINGILQEAIRTRASDIHIEPFESRLAVRFRIDGTLRDMLTLAPRLASVLVSRVKVMAKLDIAKKRIPQDGRFSLNLGQKAIDVRVSTLPSQYGERVVMRILEKDSMRLSLSDLGMQPDVIEGFKAALKRPNGILLVTGPTGSGKTTTLYASLSTLNDGSRNILTVEDPVEYALGVGQTQVNNKVGMSFSAGLRAILRQDPDVVMVGEIRDPETTEIAVQAALTGHLVLSTVHTNSAIAAIPRLRDMGVEPFLLASTITGIAAQRLVRRLCPHCKAPDDISDLTRKELGLPKKNGEVIYKAVGCSECNGIGYEGRLGLYEYVEMDDTLRDMIHTGASETQMSKHAFKQRQTLLQSGVAHILSGETTADEVLRVCRASAVEDL